MVKLAEGQVTDVVEEYLETIYRLQMREGDGAKTNDIVRTMKVVPGTVTNTVERLEKEGFVEHEPYKGVKLTEKGRKIALQVVRRHRLSERLLTDILHVNWGKAHDIACKIEHDIADEEVMERIEEALGNPKTCPHGNPIPSEDGESTDDESSVKRSRSLWDLQVSDLGVITNIADEDSEVLRYLSDFGLMPGMNVEVIKKDPAEHTMIVRLAGSAMHTITEKVASSIRVRGAERLNRADILNRRTHSVGKGSTFGEYES